MYEQELRAYFQGQEERVADLTSRLVRIPSEKGEARPGMPFGPGPAAALEEGLCIARELGFSAANYDGYVGTVDVNEHPTALHILCHLDVVGAGSGWTVTEPYTPKLVDGLLYGRGTDDDKGPAVAALLAMRAVRDLGIPLKRNVRLILGTDEESGSSDIAYYYAREPHAPYAFSPDAYFPVINTEKGRYAPVLTAAWAEGAALPRVSFLESGNMVNVVPSSAEAVVLGVTETDLAPLAARFAAETGAELEFTAEDGGLRLTVSGTGAHASTPERGVNALTALLGLLSALPLADCESTRAIRSLARLFPHGDNGGAAIGAAMEDEVSGALTLAFSRLSLHETGLRGQFDSRMPLCAAEKNCTGILDAALRGAGLSAEGEAIPAHHVPADSPFVQTLLRAYEQHTGRKGECLAIGGGTYVHNIPGGVAFGAAYPEFESNVHGPDERVSVAGLLTAATVFAQVIADLCQ